MPVTTTRAIKPIKMLYSTAEPESSAKNHRMDICPRAFAIIVLILSFGLSSSLNP
jgi:hypothetical protein